jgi:hypothetical protein
MCWLTDLFKSKIEIEYKPVSSKKASLQELNDFLRARFPNAQLWLSDNSYTLCHYDDIAYFVAVSQIDKMQYKPEEMDCDDFARALWGEFAAPLWSALAIGLVWTDVHALNICITEDWRLLFLEPQTDEMNEKLANWQGSEPKLIVV